MKKKFEDELYDIQKECELCSYDSKTGQTQTLYEKSLPYLNMCALYGADSCNGPVLVIDKFGDCYPYFGPIYSLPDPKEVTSEESEALTYAFINFIEEKMNEE